MTLLSPRSDYSRLLACGLGCGLLVAMLHSACGQSSPAQLTWGAGGGGGSGTWDTTTLDWFNGANNVPWTNGDDALFTGTAGTVSIAGSVTADKVTFSTAGYTVQNFFLDGAASGLTVEADANATISSSVYGAAPYNTTFTKTGAGVLTFTGQGPVFFGSANINAGEVRFTGSGSPNFTTPFVLANTAGVALTFSANTNEIASLAGGGTNGGVVRPYVTSGNLSLLIYGSGNATFAGVVEDNGSATLAFQKNGSSTQTLTGTNTYSSATTVSGGTLSLAGANGAAANTSAVTVNAGGTLLLDNSAAASSARLPSSITVTVNGGTFSLAGNATAASQQAVNTLAFSSAATVTASPTGTATAGIEITGGLTRQSNGTISFSDGGNVNVAGLTTLNGIAAPYITVNGTDWATVNSGAVSAYTGYTSDPTASNGQSNLRLSSASGGMTTLGQSVSYFNSLNLVNTSSAAATLDLGQGQTLNLTSGGLLTSGSAGEVIQNGTLTPGSGELIITNQTVLTVASTLANGGSASTATTLTKSGVGTLLLTGANTYTGSTVINQGTVQAAADNNLGAGSAVVLNGGTLQAVAGFTSSKSLQGSGGTVDTAGYNVAFNGGSNTGSVTKVGAGMLSLTGTVSTVTLNAGVLNLTNLAANNAATITLAGGRLEASGSGIQQVVSLGNSAEISPGSIGQAAALTIGTLTPLASGTVIDFDLGSNAKDLLTLTSTLPFGGSSTQLLLRFNNLGGTHTGVAYPLIDLAAGSLGVSTSEFGFDPASTAAGYRGTFSLANNTLSVTFTAVPEPGTWALLGLGVGALGLTLRRCLREA